MLTTLLTSIANLLVAWSALFFFDGIRGLVRSSDG